MAVTKKTTESNNAPKAKSDKAAAAPQARGLRKRQEGLVVSNKMEKTIVVAVGTSPLVDGVIHQVLHAGDQVSGRATTLA